MKRQNSNKGPLMKKQTNKNITLNYMETQSQDTDDLHRANLQEMGSISLLWPGDNMPFTEGIKELHK